MATLADLRTRVITETVRDDLADDLASVLDQKIASSIAYYANERFWFNEARITSAFVPLSEYALVPAPYHQIDDLFIVIGGVRYNLTKRSIDYIENLYTVPQVGQPTDWAYYGTVPDGFVMGASGLGDGVGLGDGETIVSGIRLWPAPNIAYVAIWLGIADVSAQLDYTDPESTSVWLTTGYDLITAKTKWYLYRDQFRDRDAQAAAKDEVDEAYSNLKGESNRRLATGRVRPSW